MKRLNLVFVAVFGLVSSFAFASGFRCEGEGFNAKLYNHVDASSGTRTPAVFVVSSDDWGTLLVAKGEQIRKSRRGDSVRYFAENEQDDLVTSAALTVDFLEGAETIEAGEKVTGRLVVYTEDGRHNASMICTRYKKN